MAENPSRKEYWKATKHRMYPIGGIHYAPAAEPYRWVASSAFASRKDAPGVTLGAVDGIQRLA
jgi:hypothetical protein